MPIVLSTLPNTYAVFRLSPTLQVPDEIFKSSFYCVSKSAAEPSVLCEEKFAPLTTKKDTGWRLLKYSGSLGAAETGIVASTAGPLAAAKISVIVYTTYDSGYFGVKEEYLQKAINVLEAANIQVNNPQQQ